MPGMPSKELPIEGLKMGDVVRSVVGDSHSGGGELDALEGE